MEFRTDLTPVREEFPHTREAQKIFARIRQFGDRAAQDLPAHRALIEQIRTAEPA
jgi:tryptophan halogenase